MNYDVYLMIDSKPEVLVSTVKSKKDAFFTARSIFNYHLNKAIKRGLTSKKDITYEQSCIGELMFKWYRHRFFNEHQLRVSIVSICNR